MGEEAYLCEKCRKYTPIGSLTEAPVCCGEKMKKVPMEVCTQDQGWAEHSRPMEDEGPCDES